MEALPTLLPFLGAVIGAMIGATVSPLVLWQIEKKRQRLAYRRELISRWRKMLEEAARDHGVKWTTDEELNRVLLNHGDYVSLVVYLTPIGNSLDVSGMNVSAEMSEKWGLSPLMMFYMVEVQRLEMEWNLV